MPRRTLKTVAALAAAALSATAVSSVASAAPIRDTGVQPPQVTTSVNANVEVAPTGDGPAGQRDCDAWGVKINDLRAGAQNAAGMGFDKVADTQNQAADEAEDAALSDGCFIIY